MSWEKINTLNLLWSSICSDDDGQNISACVSDGGIYYSNNGGTEWNKYNIPDNDWQFICSNSSGTCLAACVYNGGIWIYTNFNGWIQTDAPINYWRCICSDSTGQYLNAVAYNNSYVYSSSDYGKTWHSNIIDELQNMYYSICSDSGGNYLKVSTHGCIYSCFNGQNLKQTWIINNITYFNTGSLYSLCSSANGKILATCNVNGIYTCNNGLSKLEHWNNYVISDTNNYWVSICSSNCGQVLAACTNSNGSIYINYDNNWIKQEIENTDWSSICSNYIGNQLFACSLNNGVWKYNTSYIPVYQDNEPTIIQLENIPLSVYAIGCNTSALIFWQQPLNWKNIRSYTIKCIQDLSISVTIYNTLDEQNVIGNVNELINTKEYNFYVFSTNINGDDSHNSNISNTIILSEFISSKPLNVNATGLNNIVTLNWNSPQFIETSIHAYYIITNPGYIINKISSNVTTINIPNLKNNTYYTFTVIAVNNIGCSNISDSCIFYNNDINIPIIINTNACKKMNKKLNKRVNKNLNNKFKKMNLIDKNTHIVNGENVNLFTFNKPSALLNLVDINSTIDTIDKNGENVNLFTFNKPSALLNLVDINSTIDTIGDNDNTFSIKINEPSTLLDLVNINSTNDTIGDNDNTFSIKINEPSTLLDLVNIDNIEFKECFCSIPPDNKKIIKNSNSDVIPLSGQTPRIVASIRYSRSGRTIFGDNGLITKLSFLGKIEGQPGGIGKPLRNKF
jgi:hypothetical protein